MRYTKKVAVVLALFPIAGSLAAQNPRFAIRQKDCFEPSAPNGLPVPMDGDGDGSVDLLVSYGQQTTFYRNDGHAHFTPGATSPGVQVSVASAVGDVDGDGDDDVFDEVLYRNIGDGVMLEEPGATPPLFIPTNPHLVDLDGDGDLDLVLSSFGHAVLLANDGAGHFADETASAFGTTQGQFMTTIDADADGGADLVIGGFPQMLLLHNDGGLQFHVVPNAIPAPPSFFLAGARSADFDGDGLDDLLLDDLSAATAPIVMRNVGLGLFQPVQLNAQAFEFLWATLVDWDQDGRIDVAFGDMVHLQIAPFVFDTTQLPTRRPATGFYLVADLDGDLDPDLVAAGTPLVVTINGAGHDRSATQTATDEATNGIGRLLATFAPRSLLTIESGVVKCYLPGPDFPTLTVSALGPTTEITDAEPLSFPGGFAMCTVSGVRLEYGGTSSEPLPGAPTSTHVATGDLDGDHQDEIVLGDPTADGPEVLRYELWYGHPIWLSFGRPTLPTPTPSIAPVREAVVIADMDGDGIKDVVHELRVLRSNGVGHMTQIADFAALVGNLATDLLPIDLDGDGDLDLVVFGGDSPTALLRNDGSTFTDVSFGHLPTAEMAPSSLITAGDVDHDGDTDLLIGRYVGSNLLLNNGGTFTRLVNVAPAGVLFDHDGDGYLDVFTGRDAYHNLHDHLWARHLAAPGVDWRVRIETWRQGQPAQFAALALGEFISPVEIPSLGSLCVDPATAFLYALPLSNGDADWFIPIPHTPLVLGIPLTTQALILDGQRLTLTGCVLETVR